MEKAKLPFIRDNYIKTANKTRAKYGNNIYSRRILQRINPINNYVITSLRHPEEVMELKKHPDFVMFFIDAPSRIRFERILKRNTRQDPKTWEQFLTLSKREESKGSGQQLHKMRKMSHAVIFNDATKQVLKKKVLKATADYKRKMK